jgi:excisionase family DNA binding protein
MVYRHCANRATKEVSIATDKQTPRDDLTPQEAAQALGIDRSTMARWLAQKKVAGWRTAGGHWRIPRTEVHRLLNTNE